MNPKISIIIPTFNRANFLKKAIESALAQDYNELEIIVSDNASTDKTSEIIKDYSDDKRFNYYYNNENLGMVGNWRKILHNYINGDFFLILSDDDYLLDNKYVSKAVELIKKDSEIVLVYANGYVIYEDTNEIHKLDLPFEKIEDGKKIFLSRQKIGKFDFILSNVLFNTDLALKLNAFSNDYNLACDTELFLKMCLYGRVGTIKDYVSVYRIHSDILSYKVHEDFDLLMGSLDYFIEPYELAKELNSFSEEKLEKWKDDVVLPNIINNIFKVLIFNKNKYYHALGIIKNRDKDFLVKIQKDIRLRIFLNLSKMDAHIFVWKLIIFFTRLKKSLIMFHDRVKL